MNTKIQYFKKIAVFVIFLMLYQLIWPVVTYSLTGGPSQPEVQSYKPIGVTDMVNHFSGDFTYSIPLVEIDGFPISLDYKSGIGMEDEASWVGLGWNINPGVINREMRGLPDDFKGDIVSKVMYKNPNETHGVSTTVGAEVFGFEPSNLGIKLNLDVTLGMFHNTYKGYGMEFGLNPVLGISSTQQSGLGANLGARGNFNTHEGLDITPSLSLKQRFKEQSAQGSSGISLGMSIAAPYNSRAGLKSLSFSRNLNFQHQSENTSIRNLGSMSGGGSISFNAPVYTPNMEFPMEYSAISYRGRIGAEIKGVHPSLAIRGHRSTEKLRRIIDLFPSYGYMYAQHGLKKKALHSVQREKDGAFSKESSQLPVPSFAHDIYTVAAPNLSGTFRPFRNDVGTIHEPTVRSETDNTDLGLEAGIGGYVHLGMDLTELDVTTETGTWYHFHYF